MNDTIYYLIFERLMGKKEDGRYFLFYNDDWVPDKESIIRDHLMGYDPSEPPGSPYGIGNGSIMDDIKEITHEQAMELIGGNV